MSFDLREFEFCVVRVHGLDLILSGSSQNLDDLDQLVHSRFSWEYGLTHQEFSYNTTDRPNVDNISVFCTPEDQLRCSIVTGTYI